MEGAKILIVEDDKDILEVLSLYVKNAGYQIVKAQTIARIKAHLS